MDTSIKNGETIRGLGNFSEREDRLRKECEKRGETFYPEDDYIVPERHAEDKARADAKAAQRKRATQNRISNRNQEADSGTKATGTGGEKMNNGESTTMEKGSIIQKSREKLNPKEPEDEAGTSETN